MSSTLRSARRARGLISALLRPAYCAALGLCLVRSLLVWFKQNRRWGWVVVTCILSLREMLLISRDHVFLTALGFPTRPPGFQCKPKGRIERILQSCAFHTEEYQCPQFLFTGDFSTLYPYFAACPRPVPFERIAFPSRVSDTKLIEMDLAQTVGSTPTNCLLLVAGVGGQSNAAYIEAMAWRFLEDGWSVAVMVPHGMGSKASSVCNVFDPADLEDLHDVVALLSQEFPHVYGVGFSLGACMLTNYVARYAELLPNSYGGTVAWSGAFKSDFTMAPRYQQVFQPIIVNDLVSDLLWTYEEELRRLLPPAKLHGLQTAATYSSLHDNLFPSIRKLPWREWRASTAPSVEALGTIRTPLLLVSALDDPLHHPEMIGLDEKIWENQNVAVWLTGSGGHVAWPEKGAVEQFSFLTRITSQFIYAAAAAHA